MLAKCGTLWDGKQAMLSIFQPMKFSICKQIKVLAKTHVYRSGSFSENSLSLEDSAKPLAQ
jgi:hypothetical protein